MGRGTVDPWPVLVSSLTGSFSPCDTPRRAQAARRYRGDDRRVSCHLTRDLGDLLRSGIATRRPPVNGEPWMLSDGVPTSTGSSRSMFPGSRCRRYFATMVGHLACLTSLAPHTSPHTSQSRLADCVPQSRLPRRRFLPRRFPYQLSGHSEFHASTTPRKKSWAPPLSNSQSCC